MNYLKEHGRWITFCMAVWSISKALFISIKLWGIESTLFPQLDINVGLLVCAIGLSGLIDGLIIGLFDIEFDRFFNLASVAHRVIAKSLINLGVGMTLTIVLVPLTVGWSSEAGIELFSKKLITANIAITAIYAFLITLLLQLLKMASSWIQTNDLRQIFSHSGDGVEEDRIFMFLDMKSSTTHAEKLGAGRYSLLVQDCFMDMTKAARSSNGEIYQFVGDEAVFTWKTSEFNLRNAVQQYFNFRENLRHRSSHYRHQYGIVPEFKAGIHHGRVIRTQVGVIRKSIAFHGDAINTASRIQGKCNELGCDLLISDRVREGLHNNFTTSSQGTFQLKGKDCKVTLFSVREHSKAELTNLNLGRGQQKIQCKKAGFPPIRLWLNVF